MQRVRAAWVDVALLSQAAGWELAAVLPLELHQAAATQRTMTSHRMTWMRHSAWLRLRWVAIAAPCMHTRTSHAGGQHALAAAAVAVAVVVAVAAR